MQVRERGKVPYLATTVWAESEDSRISSEMTNRVFQDIEPDLMDKYNKIAQDLSWQISKKDPEDGVKITHGARGVRRSRSRSPGSRSSMRSSSSPPPAKRARSIRERVEAHTGWQAADSRAFQVENLPVSDLESVILNIASTPLPRPGRRRCSTP